jgi:RimJ/RimL family protein N-acetyltransferase
MLDRLALPASPVLRGERVTLRSPVESDVDDRLRHPIDPEEEDGYGSAWRREWDGARYHTREYLLAGRKPPEPGAYEWAVEYDRHCVGHAGLRVNIDQHRAVYTVGLFVAGLRGHGLGREITRLVLSWAFGGWACTAWNWRCWPSTTARSTATWPAVSGGKGCAGRPSCIPTAGRT